MIDFARITVKAGDGGGGAGSFVHIKGKRRGKADGGDGGGGGNVFLVASSDINTLEAFRYMKDYSAQVGQRGLSRLRRGAQGADLAIKVPIGTQVRLEERGNTRNETQNYAESYDLVEPGEKVLIARGGEGGRGNAHLRDEFGRRPKSGERGQEGEGKALTLELKLIADVGLIGLPNAGKSTLLAALTSARPKIANYPFTTLEPNLGVLSFGLSGKGKEAGLVRGLSEGSVTLNLTSKPNRHPNLNPLTNYPATPRKIVLADIPGLIEGASKGKGLGDLFLRHIERTKMLVHLIDISTTDDVWQTYQTVREELKTYSKDLVKKKEIIVLSKVDQVTREQVEEARRVFSAKRKKVLAISAVSWEGLEELVKELKKVTLIGYEARIV